MPLTRFSTGIGVGGVPSAGESDESVYFYNSSGAVIASVSFNGSVMTIKNSAGTTISTINFTQGSSLTATPSALNITVTDTSPYGFSASSDWTTVQTAINTLITRVTQIETVLKGMGMLP